MLNSRNFFLERFPYFGVRQIKTTRKEEYNETHIPATFTASQEEIGFPRPHGHQEWPRRFVESPQGGTQTPGSLRAQSGESSISMNSAVRPGFGRASRLRNRSEIAAVRNGGQSCAGRYCVVNILQTPPDKLRKAAFSISKRYSKLAVERNRARRLFREVFSRIYDELPESWVVFVPRHQMKDAGMWEVLEDARKCVSRILSGGAK